jgi:hypothetical protein
MTLSMAQFTRSQFAWIKNELHCDHRKPWPLWIEHFAPPPNESLDPGIQLILAPLTVDILGFEYCSFSPISIESKPRFTRIESSGFFAHSVLQIAVCIHHIQLVPVSFWFPPINQVSFHTIFKAFAHSVLSGR